MEIREEPNEDRRLADALIAGKGAATTNPPALNRAKAIAIRDLREALYQCAVEAGADVSDGSPTRPPLTEWAVVEVKRLRADYEASA